MRRSSGRRGQTEPFAALAAVAVVAIALALYAGAFERQFPGAVDRNVAEPTADRVERAVSQAGVAHPAAVDEAPSAGPEGHRTNVTLVTADDRWTAGPAPPATADNATRRASVRAAPGDVVPGRLEVRVWT